ncbi:MAG: SDR family oxidoreductase [Candidatus Marinimicrobia bacterium]|nr:SDR family oxidoreductase [Candidatus Neomarinimicrobiota bacterium]MCF7828760.1 SDR family oxidoreductase [Candidatus Neomarinimicrobiota bacterium]MCF7880677.1 SDR family oxidoreductase [Candidatus Neomarinimicrobiota bacterium]
MSKFLVTGGAGFIGSNIVHRLVEIGHSVRVLDNFSTGRRENIQDVIEDITLIEGDLRSYHIVQEAVDDVDFILHQGALPSVPRSIADPVTSNEVNVSGTLNILHAALEAGVKKVVFASSSSIYGDSEKLPKTEDMTPNPLSPYAVSKMAGEKYCKVFADIYGLHTIALRYFNVFGPGQDPTSQYSAVIPKFITSMLEGRSPTIYGDGEQSRDFTYIDNVVKANILATESDFPAGLVVNCAGHQRISVNELVNSINKIAGSSIQATYDDKRPGDVKHSYADINLIKKYLDFRPETSFNEGLQQTINWYNKG